MANLNNSKFGRRFGAMVARLYAPAIPESLNLHIDSSNAPILFQLAILWETTLLSDPSNGRLTMPASIAGVTRSAR